MSERKSAAKAHGNSKRGANFKYQKLTFLPKRNLFPKKYCSVLRKGSLRIKTSNDKERD